MRICHISTGFPISFQGGITNYVRSLAERQEEAGNSVTVICSPDNEKQKFSVECYKSKKIEPFSLKYRRDLNGLKYIEELLEKGKFDIIHIHMMLDIDFDIVRIVKKYNYVVSLHDYFYLCPRIRMMTVDNRLCDKFDSKKCDRCLSFFGSHGIFYRINSFLSNHKLPTIKYPALYNKSKLRFDKYKELLESAKLVIPVSSRVMEIYKQSGINADYKVMHIGNNSAYDYDCDYKPTINGDDKFTVVMLGSLSYSKGAELFIDLAKALDSNKFRFVFYGRSGHYKEDLMNNGILDKGPYKQSDLKNILKNADLGCVLSVWEDNGPQVVMEFLNNHVPVIGTRLGGIPDFVNNTNGFLFNPWSDTEYKELVKELNDLSDRKLLQIKASIKRTTTPDEHYEEMMSEYVKIVKC